MALEITGKVIQLLPEQTGSGRNGTWTRRDFVVETTEQYPKKVCFSGWGDKAAQVNTLQPGQTVKVSFNAESREFNGRWYTDLRAWRIDTNAHAGGDAPDMLPPQSDFNPFPPENIDLSKSPDDLPF
jgi:hypothetical protein